MKMNLREDSEKIKKYEQIRQGFKEDCKEEIKSILKENKKVWVSIDSIRKKLEEQGIDVRNEFLEFCTDELIDTNENCWVRYKLGEKELSWVYKTKRDDQDV